MFERINSSFDTLSGSGSGSTRVVHSTVMSNKVFTSITEWK